MTSSPGDLTLDDLAAAAAEAAAAVLPSATTLTAGPAQPGSPFVTAAFAGAAIAELTGVPGRIAVLVGKDLVDALAQSPLGGLDLAAATQPAIDAAANILGAHAQPANQVDLTLVVNDLGGEFTTVPLIGAGIAAAVLVPLSTLQAAKPNLEGAPIELDLSEVLDLADAADAAPAGVPAGAQGGTQAAPAAVAFDTQFQAVPPGSGAPRGMSAAAVPAQGYAAPLAVPVARGIEMLHGVDMEVTVELGRTRMTVRDLLALSPGAVLELDRAAGSPADLLVNGRLIARGEVVVVDEDFGLRVTEILDPDAVAV